ncbi:MAG: hypothetical protein ABI716_02725 [Candidatus Saccharibacteria bacterium]
MKRFIETVAVIVVSFGLTSWWAKGHMDREDEIDLLKQTFNPLEGTRR